MPGFWAVGSVRSDVPRRGTSEEEATYGGKVAAGSTPGAPGSTYRLQLTPEFGFAQAAAAADYLAELGVTHAYLSPVLDAVPGSQHGYDVTDHSRVRPELGGEDGLRALAARLHDRGLGVVLDIVPNHMAVPSDLRLNRQLWPVLRDGPASPGARWFDIDWAAQADRMLLPVLGGPLDSCLGDLRVEPGGGLDGEPALRYFDHVLPLRPETAGLPLRDLLDAQHYRLSWWQDAATSLNWRRFFDIATLIGIRVEDPVVFDASHQVILRLVSEGLVDGLRVDHPDGLADPRGYLRRLAAATGGAWVVTEKILGPDEELPADWACAGTTGYDALRLVDGLFLDPAWRGRAQPRVRPVLPRGRRGYPGRAVRGGRRRGEAGDRPRLAGGRGDPAGPAAVRGRPGHQRRRRAGGADRGARGVLAVPRLRAPG